MPNPSDLITKRRCHFSELGQLWEGSLLMGASLIGKALNFGFRECRFDSYAPSLIKLLALPYSYTINHLKIAVRRKAFYFLLYNTKKVVKFLRVLRELNVIRRFHATPSSQIKVFPTYSKEVNTSYIRNYTRSKNPIVLRYKALALLAKFFGNSTIVIHSSRGLLTHREALQAATGGILVCIIS